MKRLSSLICFLMVLFSSCSLALDWADTQYPHRIIVNVSNNNDTAMDNYIISVPIDTKTEIDAGRMDNSCNMKLYNSTNDRLLFDRENCNNESTWLHIQIPNVDPSGLEQFGVYYGNSSLTDDRDPINTWINYYYRWSFNETTGTISRDSIANKTLTLYSGASREADSKYGYGVYTDGVNDEITSPTAILSFAQWQNATVEFWVKFYYPLDNYFLGQGAGSPLLRINANGTVGCGVEGSIDIVGTSNVSDGQWHQVICQWRNHEWVNLSIDGVEEASDTTPNMYNSASGAFRVGYLTPNHQNLSIDEVRIGKKTWNTIDLSDIVIASGTYETYVAPSHVGAIETTLTEIGNGIGDLFTGMGAPLAIFIILLALGTSVGFILSSIGRRVGGSV